MRNWTLSLSLSLIKSGQKHTFFSSYKFAQLQFRAYLTITFLQIFYAYCYFFCRKVKKILSDWVLNWVKLSALLLSLWSSFLEGKCIWYQSICLQWSFLSNVFHNSWLMSEWLILLEGLSLYKFIIILYDGQFKTKKSCLITFKIWKLFCTIIDNVYKLSKNLCYFTYNQYNTGTLRY